MKQVEAKYPFGNNTMISDFMDTELEWYILMLYFSYFFYTDVCIGIRSI